jgi:hypothetical protein
LDPFATPEQLATRLGTATQAEADAGSPDVLDTLRALDALTGASADIRSACRWTISQETVTSVVSDWSDWRIYLPTMHLTAVALTLGAVPAVLGVDFTFDTTGWIDLNPRSVLTSRAYRPMQAGGPATIAWTHGYTPVPDDVVNLTLELAATRIENPQDLQQTQRGQVVDIYHRQDPAAGALPAFIRARLARDVRPVVR